jgi:hypothetical protein
MESSWYSGGNVYMPAINDPGNLAKSLKSRLSLAITVYISKLIVYTQFSNLVLKNEYFFTKNILYYIQPFSARVGWHNCRIFIMRCLFFCRFKLQTAFSTQCRSIQIEQFL